jgi:hypothetical protein
MSTSDQSDEDATLANHLEHLAAGLDDVVAMLTVQHSEGGDVNPAALPKTQALHQSLKDVVAELGRHEHLAIKADDVWAMLTRKHNEHDSGIS